MTNFWKGERVLLRGLEPEDWQAFREFSQHSAQQRTSHLLLPPRSDESYRQWTQRESGKEPEGDEFQLVIASVEDGSPAGVIITHHANQRAGRFSYGINVDPAHQRKGYASEAIRLLLGFMFCERRFHKCEVEIAAYNTASIALHRRLGFVEEGRLRDHEFVAGGYLDVVLMGLVSDEFTGSHPFGTR
jgi:RimJ/RimL family protein N-acetyltransferase